MTPCSHRPAAARRLHGLSAPATRPPRRGRAQGGPPHPASGQVEMAEQQGFAGEQMTNGEDNLPQVAILSQYVKDLSFENPNAPAVYQWQTQPQIAVDFNIGAGKLNDELHEVSLKIDVRATADGQTAFAVELTYAGLIGIRNVSDDQIQGFLLAE